MAGAKDPGTPRSRLSGTLVAMVGRALEDQSYWAKIESTNKTDRVAALKEALGHQPTDTELQALDEAVRRMKKLAEELGDKPIAS